MTDSKNKIGLFIIAILATGILPLLQVDYRYLSKVWSPGQSIGSIIGLCIWLGSIIALIWGTLAKKSWTLLWALVILYFSFFSLLTHVLMFGIYGEGMKIVSSVIVFIIFFYLFKKTEIRSQFSITEKQLKSERIITWINLFCITVTLAPYCFMVLPKLTKNQAVFDTPVKMDLEMGKENFEENKYSMEKEFGWQFLIPKNVNIKKDRSDKEDDFDKFVVFMNEDKSIYIFIHKKSPILSNEWSNIGRVLRLGSDYELIKKMHYEKIGLVFLILKSLASPKNVTVYELNTGTLKGFMNKVVNLEKDMTLYDYLLFDRNDNHFTISFLVKSNQLTEGQINQIVTRIAGINN